MSTRALLAGVAALSVLCASAAHADEKWEGDFRKCQVVKQFFEGESITPGPRSLISVSTPRMAV